MAHIEFKDIVASISPFIAVLSLCFNVYLAYLLRNKRSRLVRVDEIRGALFTMACVFAKSEIMKSRFETGQFEFWDHIFLSLYEMRDVSVKCSVLFKSARREMIPQDVKLAVNELTDAVIELYRYRDSFNIFRNQFGRQSPVDKWNAFESAKQAVSLLQAAYRSKTSTMREYLSSLY